MKHLLTSLCACVCALYASPVLFAEVNTYTVRVDEFSKLKVYDNIEVDYVCNPDSAGYAVFTCEDSIADAFMFSNKGGTLKVQVYSEYSDITDSLPKVTLYSTFINSVENQTDRQLTLTGVAPCPEISLKQVGNGTIMADNIKATRVKAKISTGSGVITVGGECSEASFTMVGTGRIIADGLMADKVTCTVFGTGSIGCWPIDKLQVKGMGSTTVFYKGTPHSIKKSGIAKIEKMP